MGMRSGEEGGEGREEIKGRVRSSRGEGKGRETLRCSRCQCEMEEGREIKMVEREIKLRRWKEEGKERERKTCERGRDKERKGKPNKGKERNEMEKGRRNIGSEDSNNKGTQPTYCTVMAIRCVSSLA